MLAVNSQIAEGCAHTAAGRLGGRPGSNLLSIYSLREWVSTNLQLRVWFCTPS
jgi:hypothetical protein